MYQTKLGMYTVYYSHQTEYHQLKREIFTQQVYYWQTKKPQPVIIDLGAHIGLSVLYFKKLYPLAQILAVEPNPESFKLLEQNVFVNHLTQVELLAKAVTPHHVKTVQLHIDPDREYLSTSSLRPGAWTGQEPSIPVTVPAITLSQVLNLYPTIDLLKIDIEGSEQAVLASAPASLSKVEQLMIEFHPNSDQSLPKLVSLLNQTGFDCQVLKKNRPVSSHSQGGLRLIHAQRQPSKLPLE